MRPPAPGHVARALVCAAPVGADGRPPRLCVDAVLSLTRREDNLSIWLSFRSPKERSFYDSLFRKAKAKNDLDIAFERIEHQEAILVRGVARRKRREPSREV